MYVRTPFTVPSHPKVCAFVRYNRPPQSSHEQKTGVDLCTFKTLSIVSLIDATSLSTNILKNEIGSGDSQTGVSVPCDVLFHLSNAKRFKTTPPALLLPNIILLLCQAARRESPERMFIGLSGHVMYEDLRCQ